MSSKTSLTLNINDQSTGETKVVVLDMAEAKRLYLALREMFGDYQRPDPKLFITPPSIDLPIGALKQTP